MRVSSKSLLSQTEPYVRLPPKATAVVRRNELACCADFVAEVFCPSECVRLIQDQASMRNVDSRIHSLRFDCCVFLFYSFSAVTFATKSARWLRSLRGTESVAIGGTADTNRHFASANSVEIDPQAT